MRFPHSSRYKDGATKRRARRALIEDAREQQYQRQRDARQPQQIVKPSPVAPTRAAPASALAVALAPRMLETPCSRMLSKTRKAQHANATAKEHSLRCDADHVRANIYRVPECPAADGRGLNIDPPYVAAWAPAKAYAARVVVPGLDPATVLECLLPAARAVGEARANVWDARSALRVDPESPERKSAARAAAAELAAARAKLAETPETLRRAAPAPVERVKSPVMTPDLARMRRTIGRMWRVGKLIPMVHRMLNPPDVELAHARQWAARVAMFETRVGSDIFGKPVYRPNK